GADKHRHGQEFTLSRGLFSGRRSNLLSYAVMAIHVTFWSPEFGTKNNSILPSDNSRLATSEPGPLGTNSPQPAPLANLRQSGRRLEALGHRIGRFVGCLGNEILTRRLGPRYGDDRHGQRHHGDHAVRSPRP